MEYRYIGKTGLRVSPVCLGTMTFGTQADKKEAFRIMDKAYDKGINFFDTAELYPVPPSGELFGRTEEIVGEWMQTKPRDSIIMASKVAGAASGWFAPPVRHGFTAKYIEIAKEAGLDPVTLATAWSKQFDFVGSTIIGATSAEQLDPIFKAMDLTLSKEILKACDKVHKEILYPMG